MLEHGFGRSSKNSCHIIFSSVHGAKLASGAVEARTARHGCRKKSKATIWTSAPHKTATINDAAMFGVHATSCCSLVTSAVLHRSTPYKHLLAGGTQSGTGVLCGKSRSKQQTSSLAPRALANGPLEGSSSSKNSEETDCVRLQQQVQGAQQESKAQASARAPPLRNSGRSKQQGKSANRRQKQQVQAQQQAVQQIAHQEQSQQQQTVSPPAHGRFRQQLKQLLQQQQAQLKEGPTSHAGLRAAARGSTALLLSLLNSQMALLVGPSSSGTSTGAGNSSSTDARSSPAPRQKRALLREALVCISWHCSTHRLLPAEAQQLQELLVGQLLPALALHLRTTSTKVLARVVFALGSCWASSWRLEDLDSNSITMAHQQQQQQQLQDEDDNNAVSEESNDDSVQHQGHSSSTQQPRQQYVHQQQAEQQERSQEAEVGVDIRRQQQQQAVDAVTYQPSQQYHHEQQQLQQGTLAQQCCPGNSAEWVQHLLPLLPPAKLSAGALLATMEGCALHELKPSQAWLAGASLAAYGMLESNKFDFNDAAALLQAYAQLDYSPPAWLMQALVLRLQQWIPFLNPADLAGVLSGLHVLGFRPGNTWLRVWCESSSRLLRGMSIGQLAAAAGALAWAGYTPKPWWGARLCDATGPLLPVASADELLLLLDAVLALRLSPAVGWAHAVYCRLREVKRSLSLDQVADAAHVLANLQLPASLYRHHRIWLAGCLKASQVQDVAGLDRSELLYLLYAAGKLKVNPGRAWLAAALQRLHAQLSGASPAELVGSFVVFCGFRLHLPLQRARGDAHVWLRDCLAAVVECVEQFSDEGLLQLLLACTDAGVGEQQQEEEEVPGEVADQLLTFVQLLADSLVARLPGMSLLQLSRVCKTLEGKVVDSSSARVGSRISSSSAQWFVSLLQKCKCALAARA